MTKLIFLTLALCFGPVHAAEVMFEGYYRIKLDHKPIGYYISRYEFDPKLHQFTCTTFQRATLGEKVVQESLKAVANDKFQPVSYQYTSQLGQQIKTIDATFTGEKMKTVTTDGSKTARTENSKIPKGTFLSSFLVYVMLQKKLSLNDAFKYSAIAEEDGNSYWGKSWLESKEKREGFTVFRVLNEFKGDKFISNLAAVADGADPDHFGKGEVFGSDSPDKNITTELVARADQATEGQLVPNKVLIALFGNLPSGKANMITVPPAKSSVPSVTTAPVKAEVSPNLPSSHGTKPPKAQTLPSEDSADSQ